MESKVWNLKSIMSVLRWRSLVLFLVLVVGWFFLWGAPTALAGLEDDRFDGNIFALYAGNGSLVPPKINLSNSLKGERPSLLFLYAEDSSDCKQFSSVISRLQAYYGRVSDFIPISIDAIPPKFDYEQTDPGYYYQGFVPQTVIFDQAGKVVLNETGQISYEQIDDVLRQVFDLLPRSESIELKRRPVNEVNVELVP